MFSEHLKVTSKSESSLNAETLRLKGGSPFGCCPPIMNSFMCHPVLICTPKVQTLPTDDSSKRPHRQGPHPKLLPMAAFDNSPYKNFLTPTKYRPPPVSAALQSVQGTTYQRPSDPQMEYQPPPEIEVTPASAFDKSSYQQFLTPTKYRPPPVSAALQSVKDTTYQRPPSSQMEHRPPPEIKVIPPTPQSIHNTTYQSPQPQETPKIKTVSQKKIIQGDPNEPSMVIEEGSYFEEIPWNASQQKAFFPNNVGHQPNQPKKHLLPFSPEITQSPATRPTPKKLSFQSTINSPPQSPGGQNPNFAEVPEKSIQNVSPRPKLPTPKTSPPKAPTPKASPPKASPPKASPPKASPPKASPPKASPPKASPPKAPTLLASPPKAPLPKAPTPKKKKYQLLTESFLNSSKFTGAGFVEAEPEEYFRILEEEAVEKKNCLERLKAMQQQRRQEVLGGTNA